MCVGTQYGYQGCTTEVFCEQKEPSLREKIIEDFREVYTSEPVPFEYLCLSISREVDDERVREILEQLENEGQVFGWESEHPETREPTTLWILHY